jgi:hypothetical protein
VRRLPLVERNVHARVARLSTRHARGAPDPDDPRYEDVRSVATADRTLVTTMAQPSCGG